MERDIHTLQDLGFVREVYNGGYYEIIANVERIDEFLIKNEIKLQSDPSEILIEQRVIDLFQELKTPERVELLATVLFIVNQFKVHSMEEVFKELEIWKGHRFNRREFEDIWNNMMFNEHLDLLPKKITQQLEKNQNFNGILKDKQEVDINLKSNKTSNIIEWCHKSLKMPTIYRDSAYIPLNWKKEREELKKLFSSLAKFNLYYQKIFETNLPFFKIELNSIPHFYSRCTNDNFFVKIGVLALLFETDILPLQNKLHYYNNNWKSIRLLEQWFIQEEISYDQSLFLTLKKIKLLRNHLHPYHSSNKKVFKIYEYFGISSLENLEEAWFIIQNSFKNALIELIRIFENLVFENTNTTQLP